MKMNQQEKYQQQLYKQKTQLLQHQQVIRDQTILKTLTLNVLFDTRCKDKQSSFLQKTHIKYSNQRFQYIIQQIQNINPDVITFNQVTLKFINYLEQNQFIYNNYEKSKSQFNPLTKYDVEGNLIMVKKIFHNLHFTKIYLKSHNQPIHVAYFNFNKKNIVIASVHLLAFKNNTKQRQTQLTQIITYFQSQNQLNNNLDTIILQGDMNFHSQKQNQVSKKLNLRDCWLQKYNLSQNPGYTFDSHQNVMINQLYWGFQQRRMRLDRVFIKQKSKISSIQVKQMSLAFKQYVYDDACQFPNKFMGWIQSGICFTGDLFGKNWQRKKQDYLFPSDHFGLLTEFKIK